MLSIKASGPKIPHIYGLVNLHKNNAPPRPVVSAPEAYYFELATFMGDILRKMPGDDTLLVFKKNVLGSPTASLLANRTECQYEDTELKILQTIIVGEDLH